MGTPVILTLSSSTGNVLPVLEYSPLVGKTHMTMWTKLPPRSLGITLIMVLELTLFSQGNFMFASFNRTSAQHVYIAIVSAVLHSHSVLETWQDLPVSRRHPLPLR
jgi:hypothetical protein